MKRGEVWTVAGGSSYSGKPRPVFILQDERFDSLDSVTICALTSNLSAAALFRVAIAPSTENGLKSLSTAMADKIITVPAARLGKKIGRLDDADMERIVRAIVTFLRLY
jgi:mRNA interferase MazF